MGYIRYGKGKKKIINGGDITVFYPDGTIKEIILATNFKKRKSPKECISEHIPTERESQRHVEWANAVKRRDQRQCVLCGCKEWLQAHHIERWADNKERRYDLRNGVTLCIPCHGKYHGQFYLPFPIHITAKLIGYIEALYNKR